MSNTPKAIIHRKQVSAARLNMLGWLPPESIPHAPDIATEAVRGSNEALATAGIVAVQGNKLQEVKDTITEIASRPGADIYTLSLLTRALNTLTEMESSAI